jgi:hypothetical protein
MSNLWVHGRKCRLLSRQEKESPPVRRSVPDPVALTYSPTTRDPVTADALAATGSQTRAAATIHDAIKLRKEPNRTHQMIHLARQ